MNPSASTSAHPLFCERPLGVLRVGRPAKLRCHSRNTRIHPTCAASDNLQTRAAALRVDSPPFLNSLEPLKASAAVNSAALDGGKTAWAPTGRADVADATTPRKRLRVAVDVDEVLGRFLHSLNQFCSENYGFEYDVGDYFLYDFAKVWQCSQDESNHIVHRFFQSTHFSHGILPIPGALSSLQRLSPHCDLVIVTSRQHIIRQPTLDWVDTHFPGVFSEVHFGNHYALEGLPKKKSEMCREVGAHVLIDDNPRYAVECAQAGISVLLYDWQHAYPWSKTEDGPVHPLIERVADWEQVERSLARLALEAGGEA